MRGQEPTLPPVYTVLNLEAPKTWRVELNFAPPTKLLKLVLLKTSWPLEQLGQPRSMGPHSDMFSCPVPCKVQGVGSRG